MVDEFAAQQRNPPLAQVGPAAGGARGSVVVIHENRGLNPYVADVARRVAAAGFTALAPDGLSPLGGYPGTDEEGKAMQRTLDRGKLLEDFFAAYRHLQADASSNGKIGAVEFCYGGGVSNAMAVRFPELAASVPFYGRQPKAADIPGINSPLLLHYAGLDKRVNAFSQLVVCRGQLLRDRGRRSRAIETEPLAEPRPEYVVDFGIRLGLDGRKNRNA